MKTSRPLGINILLIGTWQYSPQAHFYRGDFTLQRGHKEGLVVQIENNALKIFSRLFFFYYLARTNDFLFLPATLNIDKLTFTILHVTNLISLKGQYAQRAV